GSAITVIGGKKNVIIGNYINTDITGTKVWRDDPIYAPPRVGRGLPDEVSNASAGLDRPVLAGITLTGAGSAGPGAVDNIIGGMVDINGLPLVDAQGR